MQDFSQIRTLLIRKKSGRMDIPRETLLVEDANGKKSQSVPSHFHVVLPVVAYQVRLTKNITYDNIIIRTIVNLTKVYESQFHLEHGRAIDVTANALGLDRMLVKAALKKHTNQKDVETGKTDGSLSQSLYYLLYDPLSGETFPNLVKEPDYWDCTALESVRPIDLWSANAETRFKVRMDEGVKYASVLGLKYGQFSIPNEPPISNAIRSRYLKGGNGKLEYTGATPELVGMVCSVFLSDRDMSRLQVLTPLGKKNIVLEMIKRQMEREPELNRHLDESIRDLEAARARKIDTFIGELKNSDEERIKIEAYYPGIKKGFPNALKHMAVMEKRYENFQAEMDPSEKDEKLKELILSFCESMEWILTYALNKHYPHARQYALENSVAVMQGKRNIADYICPLAEKLGQVETEKFSALLSSGKKVNYNRVRNAMERARNGNDIRSERQENGHGGNTEEQEQKRVDKLLGELTVMLVVGLLQAYVQEAHPFGEILEQYPKFLSTMTDCIKLHGIKHGEALSTYAGIKPPDAELLEELVHDCVDAMLIKRKEEWKANVEYGQELDKLKEQKAARQRAKENNRQYPALCEMVEEKKAENVSFSYLSCDPNFYTECSSLLEAVLDELLACFSNATQRTNAVEVFSGDRADDNEMMHKLFQRYGCDYTEDDLRTWLVSHGCQKDLEAHGGLDENIAGDSKTNTGNIRALKDNPSRRLPLKPKFYLACAVLDNSEQGQMILGEVLKEVPELPLVISSVSISRGHNYLAEFADGQQQYQVYYEDIMQLSDKICEIMRRSN